MTVSKFRFASASCEAHFSSAMNFSSQEFFHQTTIGQQSGYHICDERVLEHHRFTWDHRKEVK